MTQRHSLSGANGRRKKSVSDDRDSEGDLSLRRGQEALLREMIFKLRL